MIPTEKSTVREIVAGDFRAASVFHKFGIDFCCGGRRPLAKACEERGVRVEEVLGDLDRLHTGPESAAPKFEDWDADTLVAYIVGQHHSYVRSALPILVAHVQTLARAHGDKNPKLHEVARRIELVAEEMTSHMAKEERVLFPYVSAVATAARSTQRLPRSPFRSIDDPIAMMEAKHDAVGAAMKQIRDLTGNYGIPANACATYRVCMQELDAFERDLHVHVHLENNVLFPKAKALVAPTFA